MNEQANGRDRPPEMQVEVTETVQAGSAADPHQSFLDRPRPGRYGPELELLGWVLPARERLSSSSSGREIA